MFILGFDLMVFWKHFLWGGGGGEGEDEYFTTHYSRDYLQNPMLSHVHSYSHSAESYIHGLFSTFPHISSFRLYSCLAFIYG